MLVKIADDRSKVELIEDDEIISISSKDFLKKAVTYLNKTENEVVPITTGFQGSNVICTIKYEGEKNKESFIFEYEKKRRNLMWDRIIHDGTKIMKDVGSPRTIAKVSFVKKKIVSIFVYVAKDDGNLITEKTDLYRFPYGNADNNCRLCTGGVSTDFSEYDPIDYPLFVEFIIYGTIFNGDYDRDAFDRCLSYVGKDFDDDGYMVDSVTKAGMLLI